MEARRPATVALTVLAYVITTFATQGTSHFVINRDHYAAIAIMRAEPVVALGLGSMIIQGTIFALLFPAFDQGGSTLRNALRLSWTIGAFLASYIVLAEAGKYAIPSIPSWIGVEATVAAVQYTLFGILLGWVHRRPHGVR